MDACERGAASACERACSAKEGHACRLLGVMHLEGVGVELDVERGLTLLVRACELGVREVCVVPPEDGDDSIEIELPSESLQHGPPTTTFELEEEPEPEPAPEQVEPYVPPPKPR
jgi:hypothetical protein